MKSFEDILRAVEFIELNLREPVSIKDAADAAGYSLYHFCRVFNSVIHHSPYDYIMRRRLSEAASMNKPCIFTCRYSLTYHIHRYIIQGSDHKSG